MYPSLGCSTSVSEVPADAVYFQMCFVCRISNFSSVRKYFKVFLSTPNCRKTKFDDNVCCSLLYRVHPGPLNTPDCILHCTSTLINYNDGQTCT